ncbi:Aste57867_24110 [Aphanomyces stellatus]|uniref:Aste57867_24110 protein n=1 Tax=Aphanomyces stellatus TaxID=120398 RepID=A0A485LPK6_9STRA|nr:hypothetical protein As57867_024036 [Aphanomyces stellatus]VFU00752.1 Aste57867_24110 [Aphanomyces stellatus]
MCLSYSIFWAGGATLRRKRWSPDIRPLHTCVPRWRETLAVGDDVEVYVDTNSRSKNHRDDWHKAKVLQRRDLSRVSLPPPVTATNPHPERLGPPVEVLVAITSGEGGEEVWKDCRDEDMSRICVKTAMNVTNPLAKTAKKSEKAAKTTELKADLPRLRPGRPKKAIPTSGAKQPQPSPWQETTSGVPLDANRPRATTHDRLAKPQPLESVDELRKWRGTLDEGTLVDGRDMATGQWRVCVVVDLTAPSDQLELRVAESCVVRQFPLDPRCVQPWHTHTCC